MATGRPKTSGGRQTLTMSGSIVLQPLSSTVNAARPLQVQAQERLRPSWDGDEDPHNPRNWSRRSKIVCTLIVSSLSVIPPISSSMVAPALLAIAKEFQITSQVEQQLVLSSYVLASGIGTLWLGPLSEIYGRVIVLQLSNLASLVFNVACGVSQSKAQLIIFRALGGFLGSASIAVDEGVLGDIWSDDEQGKWVGLYGIASLLSPAVGPILGGFLTQDTTWRWLFFLCAILGGTIGLVGLVFFHESYAPRLLQLKARKDARRLGTSAVTYSEDNLSTILTVNLFRPVRLLATQAIIQLLALYLAFLYGLVYLVLSTFPNIWTTIYRESTQIGSLNYISIGIGFILGSQFGILFSDKIYTELKRANQGIGLPEYRLPLMLPCSCLVPAGFFWYGWTAQAGVHWILPNIGAIIFSMGIIVLFLSIQLYIMGAYPQCTASALASTIILRSLAGFTFPLFAPTMYASLGYGWGNSALAFAAIAIGIPAPLLLWKFGAKIRASSRYAT